MPILRAEPLTDFTSRIFQAYAVPSTAQTVAESLVLANLKGHDSHGVIRIIEYVDWLQQGLVDAAGALEVITEQGPVLMVDGHFGFGQVIGRQATALAITKTQAEGVCLLTIRRAGHLGRIGEFMEMAAEAGLICFSLTNTHGGGVIVAPHGGRERRLSANPYSAGAPLPGGGTMIMDLATCAIAGGKIMVAKEKGVPIPPGCVVDAQGELTTDPNAFDADPPGALLPMAGHKGFALSLFAEIFAGALSGAGCSKAGVRRVANGWFAIFIDPQLFCTPGFYDEEVGNLVQWVKSSQPMAGFPEILLPGEPESRAFAQRSQTGIEIEQSTWEKILAIAARQQITPPVT